MKNLFGFGPFVGDIETEITVFIPFVNWVRKTYNITTKYFVNSHYNRGFLYDDDAIFLPISSFLSYTEEKQNKHKHNQLNSGGFSYLNRVFCKYMTNSTRKLTNNIQLTLPYSEKAFNYFHQRLYKPFNIVSDFPSKYVYIPSKNDTKSNVLTLYDKLKKMYGDELIVIGDKRTYLKEENVILKEDDYDDNGYIYIFNYIMNSKMVITPASHWTFLCNLQQKKVFSWGNNISLYKESGVFHIPNKNYISIPNNDINIVINHIEKIEG